MQNTNFNPYRVLRSTFGFGICTEMQLRLAFRRKAKDIFKASDNWLKDEKFLQLRADFVGIMEHAKNEDQLFFGPDDSDLEMTVNGVFLYALGCGLGEDANGVECDACEGDGYLTAHELKVVPHTCTNCDGHGEIPKVFTCRICKGGGKITKGKGKSEHEENCFRCKGTGKFVHPTQKKPCRKCFTSGIAFVEVPEHPVHHVCSRCHGKGEILNPNPVIPKKIGIELIGQILRESVVEEHAAA